MRVPVVIACAAPLLLSLQACTQTAVDKADLAYSQAQEELKACEAAADASPQAKVVSKRLVDAKTKFLTEDQANDKGHLTKDEKATFRALRGMELKCRDMRIRSMQNYSAWKRPLFSDLYLRSDAIGTSLLADEITVGQYNQKRVEIGNQFDKDYARARADRTAIFNSVLDEPEPEIPRSPLQTQPNQTAPIGVPIQSSAHLRSSYISGRNRICIYDRLGNEEHETIRSVDICPQTLN